ncbi:membrane protein insertase YidC [Rhodanobacter glycinis]|uniref:Membrane protein insertase YidC n=1 Tax=Rhodanobacter glycinis TaxID=582702 RepID=A0A502FBA2_9GAMM|nr:membrane protein insertase YidC [Rhodanobacter glycinis]TPG09747.1 membrane protein insertase YidC [Rhodanobacter glycinis]TPG46652.1 membrane protein insertase YidC [Rhodanobacter glycinis]
MNQTRTFLMFALLAVAYLLFIAWEKDYAPPPPVAAASASSAAIPLADGSVPGAIPTTATPTAASGTAAAIATDVAHAAPSPSQLITINTDVLHLSVDTRGGSVVHADLLAYPNAPRTHKAPNPPPTVLLANDDKHYFVAQSGLVSSSDTAPQDQPNHQALFQSAQTAYTLADGQNELNVDLTWQDAAGLKVTKTYSFKRGSYVIGMSQRIDNGAAQAWQGNAYLQLLRVEPPKASNWLANYTNPETRSFQGAAWYTGEKFEKLSLADFKKEKDQLNSQIKGGWAAMLRLYFVTAWIPPAGETDQYTTQTINPDSAQPRYLIRAVGPTLSVAPGQSFTSQTRLYLGPNVQGTLDAVAPGLDLTIDYGMFKVIAVPMHWVLSQFHAISKNWGLSIILLVLLIKGLSWKLTAVQYKSSAKMRKLAPRIQALKERYGDDKVKMQQATMELYKKEKVNPMGGCLPVLITMPVFYGLFYVLEYSLELRHAAFLWIPDLSAPDPFYILPIIYALVMLGTQWLNPVAAGMDPAQAKMMKVMPLLFTVMFAFFPAGLCLYYAVNGLVGLGQQWWVTHHVDREQDVVKAA